MKIIPNYQISYKWVEKITKGQQKVKKGHQRSIPICSQICIHKLYP